MAGETVVKFRRATEHTHHRPQMRNAHVAPKSADLLLQFIQTAKASTLVHSITANDLPHLLSRVSKAKFEL